ncbi:MAG: hypothetical protein NTZ49_01420 [Candidatus Parcubacteria bacterium]|nr:hypothetical protein [Candidatus Parcubacteria bacterium]
MERGPKMGGELPENSSELETLEIKELQKKADSLMEELPNLDFTDSKVVLDWLNEFQAPSNNRRIKKDIKTVLSIFKEHNYKLGTYTNQVDNHEDRDNVARFLIGQALLMLKDEGYIPSVIHRETKNWERKFKT